MAADHDACVLQFMRMRMEVSAIGRCRSTSCRAVACAAEKRRESQTGFVGIGHCKAVRVRIKKKKIRGGESGVAYDWLRMCICTSETRGCFGVRPKRCVRAVRLRSRKGRREEASAFSS